MKKIGIIGFGKIARAHQEAFEYLGHPIQFSVNRSEAGRQKAIDAGISNVYSDMHEAVQIEKPDALIVCVGFEDLFAVTQELISYELPILMEKPSGVSLDEHQKLKKKSAEYGDKVQLGLNRRFYSVFQKAIDDMGGMDNISSVDVEWSERPKVLLDRGLERDSIAKIIYGNSIHGIDLLCWLAGNLKKYSIITKSFGEPFRWYMHLNGISEKGVVCTFKSSWDYPVPWRVVLGAEGKRYQFSPLESCVVQTDKGENYTLEPSVHDLNLKAGFYNQSEAFLSLMDGGPNQASIGSADDAMQISTDFFKGLW